MKKLAWTGAPPGVPGARVVVAGTKSRLCGRRVGVAGVGVVAAGAPNRWERKSPRPPPWAIAAGPSSATQNAATSARRAKRPNFL